MTVAAVISCTYMPYMVLTPLAPVLRHFRVGEGLPFGAAMRFYVRGMHPRRFGGSQPLRPLLRICICIAHLGEIFGGHPPSRFRSSLSVRMLRG